MMRSAMNAVLIYALLWLTFGAGHTLLTMPQVKLRLEPYLRSFYRVAYNLFALLHITLVLVAGKFLLDSSRFSLLSSAPLVLLSTLVLMAGVVLMVLALRQYDLGLFSGLSQWRAGKENRETAIEPLQISGLNRWVRHPIYTGLFLFLWGLAVSPFGFWTAAFASVYLFVGAKCEEAKLIKLYGQSYKDYQQAVPAFFSFRISNN